MNIVLVIVLILFSILVVLPVAILGICSYVYVISGYNPMHFARKVRKNSVKNGVKIKYTRIGNKYFSINTIKDLTIMGIKPYGHLGDQLEDLKNTVKLIVEQITSFELEKNYLSQDIVQSQVEAFCNNFKELGKLLAICEIVSGEAINDIISKIWNDNRVILAELHDFANYLEKYIEINKELLFSVHSSEAAKFLKHQPEPESKEESKTEKN